MITDLTSIARQVEPIVLDIYDRENAESLLPFIARVIDNTTVQQTPYELEWWSALPELRRWLDKKTAQKVFTDSWQVSPQDWEITYEFDRTKENQSNRLVRAQELAQQIPGGLIHGRVREAAQVLRDNALCYDGQNLFDSDHTHFDGTTYSNVLVAGSGVASRATAASPTAAEISAEFKAAQVRLMKNTQLRNTLVSAERVADNLVAIAHSDAVYAALHDVLILDRLTDGGPANQLKGKFRLIKDMGIASANHWDLIHAEPGGLRPVIAVMWRDVPPVKFGAENFNDRYVPFGVEDQFAAVPGFPQTVVRVYTT